MIDRTPYLTSLVCFFAGGIAGATAALLLAPQSGSATRASVARKLTVGADRARQARNRVVEKGGEAWGEATQRVSDAASALSGDDGKLRGTRDKNTAL